MSQTYAVQCITSKKSLGQVTEEDRTKCMSSDNKIAIRETSLIHHVYVAGISILLISSRETNLIGHKYNTPDYIIESRAIFNAVSMTDQGSVKLTKTVTDFGPYALIQLVILTKEERIEYKGYIGILFIHY